MPNEFFDAGGTLMMRGAVTSTLHGARGSVPHTKTMNLPVQQATTGAASGGTAATCDILNLVLGPLDLNLRGLEIHLNQVVLDIVAVTGAGNCWATCCAPSLVCWTAEVRWARSLVC